MMRHLSNSLSFSRTSSSGVFSGSRLGPRRREVRAAVIAAHASLLFAEGKNMGRWAHVPKGPRPATKLRAPTRSAIAVARVRRGTELCLRPRTTRANAATRVRCRVRTTRCYSSKATLESDMKAGVQPNQQPGVKIPKKDEKNKDEPSGTRGESYS